MSVAQVGINDAALRNAAAKVERIGYDGDAYRFVESLVLSVLADGYARIDPPPALRGPTSTEAGRQAAHDIWEAAKREKASQR